MSDKNALSNLETLLAEIQALKLLLITVVSAANNRDQLVATYLRKLEGLEALSLFESEIPDSLRDGIVAFGRKYAEAIQRRPFDQSGG